MEVTPADVARVIEAADTINQRLDTIPRKGFTIAERLTPEQRAALTARIDADNA